MAFAAKLIIYRRCHSDDTTFEVLWVKSPKYWTLPGGRIEPGETSIEALLRELDEELPGISELITFPKYLETYMSFGWTSDVYIAQLVDDKPIVTASEILMMTWLDAHGFQTGFWERYFDDGRVDTLIGIHQKQEGIPW